GEAAGWPRRGTAGPRAATPGAKPAGATLQAHDEAPRSPTPCIQTIESTTPRAPSPGGTSPKETTPATIALPWSTLPATLRARTAPEHPTPTHHRENAPHRHGSYIRSC